MLVGALDHYEQKHIKQAMTDCAKLRSAQLTVAAVIKITSEIGWGLAYLTVFQKCHIDIQGLHSDTVIS